MHTAFDLKDKMFLITGASSGIGRSTAIEISKLGGSIFISGRNKEELKKTKSFCQGFCEIVCADLIQAKDILNLVEKIKPLDGLVLSSGVDKNLPLQFSKIIKVKEIFEINLFAQIELVYSLIKAKMLKSNSSIVAISSIAGNFTNTFGESIYGASKAALSSWIKGIALELAHKKIRANCICPGPVDTPMVAKQAYSKEDIENLTQKIPLKRFINPEEIALACIFLLSDASKMITGTNIVIDGGLTI